MNARAESGIQADTPLRVAVDARTVYSPHRRGTGKNLIDLYRTLARQQHNWRFLMLHQRATTDDPFVELPNVRAQRIDIPGDRLNLWQDVRLPIAAWATRANVLHCPANTAPLAAATPVVLTIHDLNPVELSPNAPSTRRWLGRVRRSARLARRIITPSNFSRAAIIERLGVPDERITTNYWAPDRQCRPADAAAIAAVRQRYDLPDQIPYVLTFGAEDPRKNTMEIIDAWSRLPNHVRSHARLLIIGVQAGALARMKAAAHARVPDGSCLLHGFSADADIAPLLSGASALCYPSRAEGFGLPVIDAFACGTPVITSTSTSLPEIAGDAALLVDPTNIDDIARALKELLESASTQDRLRRAGQRRLELFSWERCARTAAEVLARAAT